MQNSSEVNSNEGFYQVFVTGIPRKTNIKLIVDYFIQFGSITVQPYKSYFKKNPNKNQNYQTNKFSGGNGYCLISTTSQSVYQNIMNHPEHNFQGRTLGISKYMSGKDLILYNNRIRGKRVIIKKVPSSFSLDELKSFIEQNYGPVQQIYVFKGDKSEDATKKHETRKNQAYSVVLHEKKDAKALADKEELVLPSGNTAIVQKFKRNRPNDEVKVQKEVVNVKSEQKIQDELTDNHSNKISGKSFRNRESCSGVERSCGSRKNGYCEILSFWASKPTTKEYHSLKSRLGISQGFSRGDQDQSILRFNIRIPSDLV